MGAIRDLPDDIAVLLDRNGLFRASECESAGIGRGRLRTLQQRGLIVALAKGVYVETGRYSNLRPWQQFTVATQAFLEASPEGAIAAGWSAAALHQLPTLTTPPSVPSVIRRVSRRSGSNRTPNGHTRFAAVPDRWVTEVNETPTLHQAVTVLDLARTIGPEWSLILADVAALRAGSNAELVLALDDMKRWNSIKRADWVVENADPDSESALESAGRSVFIRAGIPVPISNAWLGVDRPVWRVDHYWPDHYLAAEADGLAKYSMNGDSASALQKEKDREIDLHKWGVRTLRYGWKRAFGQSLDLAAQARRMLDTQAPGVHPGLRWWSNLAGRRILGLPPHWR